MPDERENVSTGDPVLDGMLRGGLPANRAVLVAGGPGTGKSTLGMQFLQAGLAKGETALYVSTEQTIEELRDSFRPFSFDVDHENLAYASVHASPGRTIESGERELTLQTLGDDGEILGEGFSPPFTGEYVMEYLDRYAPRDRIVFDSVSGLSAITEREEQYRRTVLDLIRQFTDEFDATTLFTAEDHGTDGDGSTMLRFTTHGVIELHRERVDGDPHNYLEVLKMRGVDHDRRTVETEFTDDGLRVAPKRRSQPPALKDHAHRPVGIDGLDALCGGGLVQGTGVVLQHDGRANLSALFSALLADAVETDHVVTLVPTIGLRQGRIESILEGHSHDVDDLLADGRLQVVDVIGAWDRTLDNVFGPRETAAEFTNLLADLDDRADGPRFSVVNGDAISHVLGADGAREVRYFQESRLLQRSDTLLYVLNPSVVEERVAEFHKDVAEQVLDTRITDSGLQYLTLRKSPCGFVGSTSLVEYIDEPPYIRVQAPPRDRRDGLDSCR
ncbi:MAG: RAD55 family ATPase [Haloferacaceae archaeon]